MSNLLLLLLALSLFCSSSGDVVKEIAEQAGGVVHTLENIGMIPVHYVYSLLGMKSVDQLDIPAYGGFHETKISSVANDGSDLITIVKSPESTLKMTRSLNSDTLTIGRPDSALQSTVQDILGLLTGMKLTGSLSGNMVYEVNPHNALKTLPGYEQPMVNAKFWSTGQVEALSGRGPARRFDGKGRISGIPFDVDSGGRLNGHTDGPLAEQHGILSVGHTARPIRGHSDGQFDDGSRPLSAGISGGPLAKHSDKPFGEQSAGSAGKK